MLNHRYQAECTCYQYAYDDGECVCQKLKPLSFIFFADHLFTFALSRLTERCYLLPAPTLLFGYQNQLVNWLW
ncbi:hypothetical protein EAO10_27030 [Klebsiella pneumoniae]|nr:hypothetical protein EAO10_27030 [Klebsiella pneumoniae]